MFGKTPEQAGFNWWELSFISRNRLSSPFLITFSEVATHNHFVLDRGGKVFKQSAPIIKLPADATEDDHLALLGLLGPSARVTAQRLAFDGHDLLRDAASIRGRRVGVVFQDTAAALNPALTIGSQLIEPMRLHLGTERRLAWERGTDLLAEMGVPRPAQVMRSYPHQLSGGMKQRVSVARAFANDPEILLMDEPFAALDEQTKITLHQELLRLWSETCKTVVFITHSIDEALVLADRVVVMSARPGRALADIPVSFRRPRLVHELTADAEFGRLWHDIWTMLKTKPPVTA